MTKNKKGYKKIVFDDGTEEILYKAIINKLPFSPNRRSDALSSHNPLRGLPKNSVLLASHEDCLSLPVRIMSISEWLKSLCCCY